MQIFDRIDPRKLDQRDAALWMLAITTILVLASGMALLMYPSAFGDPATLGGSTARKIFFSFCILCFLLASYLMERQMMVRHLRKQLQEERARTSLLLSQVSAELLESLPGYEHFLDRLALDFARAVSHLQPLSLVLARLKASRQLADPEEASMAYVDAAKAIIRRLRGQDSIYLLTPGVFGILLPGVRGDDANRVAGRLSEGLAAASAAGDRFSFDLRLVNFPEHIATAHEMEQVAHSYFAEARPQRKPD